MAPGADGQHEQVAADQGLAEAIETHPPDDPALIADGRVITFGELSRSVARVRSGLAALRLDRGSRIGLVSRNDVTFVVSLLAAWGAGLVVVPVNPESPWPELARQLDVAGAETVLVGRAGAGAAGQLNDRRVLSIGDAAFPGAEVLQPGPPADIVPAAPGDLAALMFTAGTVGAPRAAMLTHGNLGFVQRVLGDPDRGGLRAGDVSLGALPFFHIYGLNVVLCPSLRLGACVVLVDEEHFEPAATLELVQRHRVTAVAGVPPMWQRWADMDGVSPEAFSTVQRATSGGAALPLGVFEAMRDRFGVEIVEGYGLTETSPVVASGVGLPVRAGSIGSPVPGVEVRLVDTDGEDALEGDRGEVWVRGPNVFAGYWQDPDATEAVMAPGGWLRTGDVAVADGEYLFLVDRLKDLIIVSGFNVFPAEVEEVLSRHPAVQGAVVVGEPDDHTGERVTAYVSQADGTPVDTADLQDFARRHLARYKCPTTVRVVERLPITPIGKAVRRQLR